MQAWTTPAQQKKPRATRPGANRTTPGRRQAPSPRGLVSATETTVSDSDWADLALRRLMLRVAALIESVGGELRREWAQ